MPALQPEFSRCAPATTQREANAQGFGRLTTAGANGTKPGMAQRGTAGNAPLEAGEMLPCICRAGAAAQARGVSAPRSNALPPVFSDPAE